MISCVELSFITREEKGEGETPSEHSFYVAILLFPLSYVGVFPSFFPSDVIHCKKLQQHPQIYLRLMAVKQFRHLVKLFTETEENRH